MADKKQIQGSVVVTSGEEKKRNRRTLILYAIFVSFRKNGFEARQSVDKADWWVCGFLLYCPGSFPIVFTLYVHTVIDTGGKCYFISL